MELRNLRIKEIFPAVFNPRLQMAKDSHEYLTLRKSLLEFGLVDPLIWNRHTNRLVGGHQRLEVLHDLYNEGHKQFETVPVSVVDLEEEKEIALNIALNKIQSDWDMPKLKDLLEELDNGDFDIELTGFDLSEVEDLMTQYHIPDKQEKPKPYRVILEVESKEVQEELISHLSGQGIKAIKGRRRK